MRQFNSIQVIYPGSKTLKYRVNQKSQDTLLFKKQKGKWNSWIPQQVMDEEADLFGYLWNIAAILKFAVFNQSHFFLTGKWSHSVSKKT